MKKSTEYIIICNTYIVCTVFFSHIGNLRNVLFSVSKGGFFSESEIRFCKSPNLQKNIPKNYPELEI